MTIKSKNGNYTIEIAEERDRDGDICVDFGTECHCMHDEEWMWFYDLEDLEQIRDMFTKAIEEFKRVQEKPLT